MYNMYGYIDHEQEQVCLICGEIIPQIENESECAELGRNGYACYDCQNQKADWNIIIGLKID